MKKITTQEIRDLFNRVMIGEISFPEMVEIMNERVSEPGNKCVEDIPVRKFQKGDKVRIKDGISSRTVHGQDPVFQPSMNDFVCTTMTVNRYTDVGGYVVCDESSWRFNEYWLEPYTNELKNGDLAIFWDNEKEIAIIKPYGRPDGGEEDYFQHRDQNGFRWRNAIKFESKEQFNRFIKGDI